MRVDRATVVPFPIRKGNDGGEREVTSAQDSRGIEAQGRATDRSPPLSGGHVRRCRNARVGRRGRHHFSSSITRARRCRSPIDIPERTAKRRSLSRCWGIRNYSHAEASLTQGAADWLGAHVRALEYFGGAENDPEVARETALPSCVTNTQVSDIRRFGRRSGRRCDPGASGTTPASQTPIRHSAALITTGSECPA